ncbi:MAG: hypothetical protein EBR82_25985 [Caulobacteraceae bacterium]|nr:hypothetical protein [Caulobacteraceae bacterium]
MTDGMSEAYGMSRRKENDGETRKYIVFYVDDCTPKVRKFDSLEKAKRFAVKVNSIDNRQSSWVDYIVKGKILMEDK